MKLTRGKQDPRWRAYLRVSSSCFAAVAVLAFVLGFFGFLPGSATTESRSVFSCTPDGRVQVPGFVPTHSGKWDPQTALWITLAFGHFTFTGAKALDSAWDLVIGRGGQLLITYWSYPPIRRTLLLASERFPIHWPLYASLAFDQVSLSSTWELVRGKPLFGRENSNSRQERGFRTKSFGWRWLAVLPLFLYLMAFPSLMSIMTGYQADLIPYVKMPNGDLVLASQLIAPPVIVVDGSRIGLTDFAIVQKEYVRYQALVDYFITFNKVPEHISSRSSFIPGSIGSYDDSTGVYNSSTCSFTFDLGPRGYVVNSTLTIAGQTWRLFQSALSVAVSGIGSPYSDTYWSVGSVFLSSSDLAAAGRCQPTNTYVWGFSFLILFVTCIWTIVFLTILGALYYDTYLHSADDRIEQSVSMYQDILDVAAGIRSIIHPNGEDSLTAAELEAELKKSIIRIRLKGVDGISRREQEDTRQQDKKTGASMREQRDEKTAYADVNSEDLP